MNFIGPTLPGGIAQLCYNYSKLFPGSTYYTLGQEIPELSHAFIFAVPAADTLLCYLDYFKSRIKNITMITICETETVHENYGVLMKEFKRVAVPSEFCKKVLSRQFPDNEFFVIPPHIPKPPPKPYIFYTIGNMNDPRKNFQKVLDTFSLLDRPNARLVIKQQSNDAQIDLVHRQCDCYINFSHSEGGIGMGAIEAALRDKPVIKPGYAGGPEYVKTPYTIECVHKKIGQGYYLFTDDMIWGEPDPEQLLEFMRDAYDKQLRYMNHEYTKNVLSPENIVKSFESITI